MNKIRRVGLVGIGISIIIFAKSSHSALSVIMLGIAFLIFSLMALLGSNFQKEKLR